MYYAHEKTGSKFPIKVAAHKTGLSLHVIRAWEKRYNAVSPQRTETNWGLYSGEDIQRLLLPAQVQILAGERLPKCPHQNRGENLARSR